MTKKIFKMAPKEIQKDTVNLKVIAGTHATPTNHMFGFG